MHVVHPLLKQGAVEFRGYQANLARLALRENTLVVLPTGMGKTVVALLVLADALKAGAQRILILAPTKPLVEQHGRFLESVLVPPWNERVRTLTGDKTPEKRRKELLEPGFLVATPQVIQNDIVSGSLAISSFDWVVFDEAHRGTGEYPYAFIGQEIQRKAPKVRRLGLTASPGHDAKKLDEVRTSLGLGHVEIRTATDPDVAPYVQEVGVEWETLPLPPVLGRVSNLLRDALADRVRQLKGFGFLKNAGSRPTRKDLLQLAGQLQGQLQSTPNPDSSLYTGLSLQAQAIKLLHAIEQAETQGAPAFVDYIEGIREEARSGKPSKATKSILEDNRVNEAFHVARMDDTETPKLGRTASLVQQQLELNAQSRVIVFTHYRATCEAVVEHLGKLPGVKPVLFVGQSKKGDQGGLTQKQQAETVQRFKDGVHNVLVATSVAEEGLDIPEVDLVVFYEPIASEIRSIQRRGRTGRKRSGRVVVLMTKGTQDEAAHWAARRKEAAMVRELQSMRGTLGSRSDPTLPSGQLKLEPAAVVAAESYEADVESSQAEARKEVAAAAARRAGSEGQAALPADPSPRTPSAKTTLDPLASAPKSASSAQSRIPAPLAGAILPGPRIVFDHREQGGGVVKGLHELGASLEPRQLEVADFVLSDRVAVERKSMADFVDSLVDGRLFDQLRALKSYPRPFLVLEGESLYGHRNVSSEAILGALASVSIDYGIPVIECKDGAETARFLHAVAKREQQRENRKVAIRPAKPAMTDRERQLFVLCGLPGISDTLAERLLLHFGTLDAVLNAPVLALSQVEGIGPQKASEMRRLLDLPFVAERLKRAA